MVETAEHGPHEAGLPEEDESERVREWWEAHGSRFDPELCYDKGHVHSLGRWVDELATAPPQVFPIILGDLTTWTGQDFGSERPEAFEKWRAFWADNAARFPDGKRYYWGHPV
ncbi:hypothetical protein [Sorangium sp. So ce542]|uniref:hypothetical protein n=1 Tax=Sorangium sp. So ce542 TaxID=3133316 RepID=UPI003F641BE4